MSTTNDKRVDIIPKTTIEYKMSTNVELTLILVKITENSGGKQC